MVRCAGRAMWIATSSVREFIVSYSGRGARESNPRRAAVGGACKRAVDITIASAALVVLAPILLATAGLIRLLIGRPIVLAEEVIGFEGRAFASYKFRTAAATAEFNQPARVRRVADLWREWAKRDDKSGAESLGELLCMSSLDRLPQFFNVVRGDMSLIGPRPITAAELPCYRDRAPEYFAARPGLTGLWRHTRAHDRDGQATTIPLDRYYVRRWSMWLDLGLFARAVFANPHADETE